VYVSPRERLSSIVAEVRPWQDEPPEVRSSSDLATLKHRWEGPLVEEYLRELPQKMANNHNLLAAVERFVPGGKLMDLGCGPGLLLAAAKERGWQVHGVEPLVGFAVFGRSYFGVDITNGLLDDASFPNDCYDVVTAIQVLEHLPDPLATLRSLYDVIRPGGLIVVETPSISNIWVTLLRSKHRHFVEDHLYFFSPETLSRLVAAAGFSIAHQGSTTRLISLRSLIRQILRNVGVNPRLGERLLCSLPGMGATLSVNLGDIIYTFAVKPR
jgi:2-polyprenyl-3-methyl-5-hydroxy-6-metoxy-1,4-benzoquinol methylase